MKLFSLDQKNAVVTGGYGHLGTAMVSALLEAGCIVYVLGRSEEKFYKIFNSTKNVHFIPCDLTQYDSIENAFKYLAQKVQCIDVLINNAISAPHWAGVKKENYNHSKIWEEAMRGGILSTVGITDALLPLIKNSKSGSIINIGSMYGVVSPDLRVYPSNQTPSPAYYAATKGGIIQWTKYIACELAPHQVRVNCVSPGAFPKPEVYQDKVFIRNLENKVPMGRLGQADELKGVILFLASGASSYVTGQNISVDGGWTAW